MYTHARLHRRHAALNASLLLALRARLPRDAPAREILHAVGRLGTRAALRALGAAALCLLDAHLRARTRARTHT